MTEAASVITSAADPSDLKEQIIAQIRTVFDPEIPVNIYELGLIYRLDLFAEADKHRVEVDMTLTSPGCPVAGTMPGMVQQAVEKVPGLTDIKVALVWDPPWDQSRMTEAARLELNMF
jgi:FeS assembly SUF system protein